MRRRGHVLAPSEDRSFAFALCYVTESSTPCRYDHLGSQVVHLLVADAARRNAGFRCTHEYVVALAERIQQETKRFRRPPINCPDWKARVLAAYMLAARMRSAMICASIERSRGLSSGTSRDLDRELERLTRLRPKPNSISVSAAADAYLTESLSARKEFSVLSRWSSRHKLDSEIDRIALAVECRSAAEAALSKFKRVRRDRGRPADVALESFIGGMAGAFQSFLGTTPSGNPRTTCRRLMAVVAEYCDIRLAHLCDPDMRSEIAERAVRNFKDQKLPVSTPLLVTSSGRTL